MKDINELTIKEFNKYTEYLEDKDNPDIYGIFELFGEDANKMNYLDFEKKWKKIQNMTLSTKGVKRVYKIGNKEFKACLNPSKLKAGQFVDFQNFIKNNAGIEVILSVFLLPIEKKWFIKKVKNYNDGYDLLEVQEYLLNNFKIGEANELSNFFLHLSIDLLTTTKAYLIKKKMKMKLKNLKKNKIK